MNAREAANAEWKEHAERWVCTGYARLTTGKLALSFIREADGADAGMYEVTKMFRHYQAGHVYHVRPTETGASFRPFAEAYVGHHKDRDTVAGWQVESRAVEARHRMLTDAQRAPKDAELRRVLAPLRHRYHRILTGTDRLAYELAVLQALRTAPRPNEDKGDEHGHD